MLAPTSYAFELGSEHLQLRGFGTLGAVSSGDETLGFRKNLSQNGVFDGDWSLKTDSVLGLQLDASFNDKLSGAIQLVGKDRPENSLEKSLEWAFLRYQFNPDLVMRAGRMAADLFMLSDYLNVGFAYLWVRPPTEFYGALALDYYDGIDLSYSRPLDSGRIQFRVFSGSGDVDFASPVGPINFELSRYSGLNLTWESQQWTHRAGYVRAKLKDTSEELVPLIDALEAVPTELWPEAPALAAEISGTGRLINYYMLGSHYDEGDWQLQGELGYVDSDYEALFPDLISGYISVGRRFGPVTAYGVGSVSRNTGDTLEVPPEPSNGQNPLLAGLAFGTQLLLDRFGIDQQSLSLGMRWDLRHNLALKLQWDHTRVDSFGAFIWDQRATIDTDRSIDTFSINLNIVF